MNAASPYALVVGVLGAGLAAMALKSPLAPVAKRPLFIASRRVDFHLQRHAFSRWKNGQVDLWITASTLIADMLVRDGVPASKVTGRSARTARSTANNCCTATKEPEIAPFRPLPCSLG